MARLNEPAPSMESLESLKRKFMRQNRDIARVNSTQSLRIRNLENETSRLLSENLSLRGNIIRLESELENGRAQKVADHAGVIKAELEQKLLEIGALLTGLGDGSPRKKTKMSPRSSKLLRISSTSPSRTPEQKNWKNRRTSTEMYADQDGRLPPILENKAYPRRTLERQEIIQLVNDAALDTNDSPEIGPPPTVSAFVNEDPVKIDLPRRSRPDENDDLTGLHPELSMNLEQRKKRKDSIAPDSKQPSRFEPILNAREITGSMKVGAKRKHGTRDEESGPVLKVADVPQSRIQHTTGISEDKANSVPTLLPAITKGRTTRDRETRDPLRDNPSSAVSIGRRVLAPKSVNRSPVKVSSTKPAFDEMRPRKDDDFEVSPLKLKEQTRDRKEEVHSVKSRSSTKVISVLPESEHDRGGVVDVILPTIPEPTTGRAHFRDTPPPVDLGTDTEIARPSRRSRPAVSYAEPSLRDKMRRPGKELIDAVRADGKVNRESGAIKLEEDVVAASIVRIKAEPDDDDAWKRISSIERERQQSLRGDRTQPCDFEVGMANSRRRRESLLHEAMADAAIVSETDEGDGAPKARATAASKCKADEIDIYTFRSSSPLTEPDARAGTEGKPSARTSRRASAAPGEKKVEAGHSLEAEALKRPSSALSKRRQSTIGRSSSSASIKAEKEEEGSKLLRRSASTNAVAGSERIAARRRSMMI